MLLEEMRPEEQKRKLSRVGINVLNSILNLLLIFPVGGVNNSTPVVSFWRRLPHLRGTEVYDTKLSFFFLLRNLSARTVVI